MPSRWKPKRFWKSITSGLDIVLPNRGASQSSISLPDAPTSTGGLQTLSGRSIDTRSETDLSTTIQDNTTNLGGEVLSELPTLLLARATSEVTLPQQASEPDSEPTEAQLTPLPVPIRAIHTSPAGFTTSAPSASDGWAALNAFLQVLDQGTRAFGPLKAVVKELIGCIKLYERVANGREEFRTLRDELEGIFGDLQWHFSRDTTPTITASMESLCRSILKELGYVKGQQGRSATRQHLEAREDWDRVLACYRRVQGHLQRLSLNADLSMWKIVDEQAMDARVDRLCPSLSACYNSRQAMELLRGACTQGTRVDVLGQVYSWVHDRAEGSVYWLNGMAGTGKTTIAYSLCDELEASHYLGASFFCSRSLPECRDVNQIVPSVAYQLAHFSRPFRCALSRVLEKRRNVHTQLLHIQFEALVIQPLVEVRDTLPESLVVVIDALDECENKRSTAHVLEVLLTKTPGLPIRFFVTSRPEPEIRDQMSHRTIPRLVLHELDSGTVQGDIETYLRAALDPITPSESQLTELVQRAGILFIYAATVVRYIGYDNFGRNPISRLEAVLSASTSAESHAYQEIDELYTVIIKAAIDDPRLTDQERHDLQKVLHAVLCAQEPLTINALSGLLGLRDIKRVHAALRPLWSVLHVVESSGQVTTLHTSFHDYMFNPKRSKDYFCDQAAQDNALFRHCFNCIKDIQPQFNICRLESSYVPDTKVVNLSAKIEKAISPELVYACRSWATHLERAEQSSDLAKLLEEFLSEQLLLWMEVMNLKRCMDVGVGVIRQAEEWCMRQVCSEGLTELAYDAWRFVAAFTSSPISKSTPHIYVSMLPFWPESSPIAKRYAKRMQIPVVPEGSAIVRRRLELLAAWLVGWKVGGVIWSPDGTRVALVAGGQIFIQDAITGRIIIGPLKDLSWVQSIVFSVDGARIASGSKDGTIAVWDSRSGKRVLGPLKGHTSWVTSVAFSPDSTRIVSGSYDMTLRIWDTRSGQNVLDPLRGHTRWVMSVAFSPNGNHIASGSDDKTIYMWDARSGQIVLGPLKGHTELVASVAFSPDSTYIISGSWDTTIRMWDARSGLMVLGPLKGHTDPVRSIAFSHDGAYIVSGSDDKTIRMWDARSGQTVLGPLGGHTSWVTSVAFSPDDTRIVSGSDDNTICLWDTRSTQAVLSPLQGHTHWVTSVGFSATGAYIVSGSSDKSICVWDARSGQLVLGPLRGHTHWVTSVAFSPDSNRIASGSWDKTIRMWDILSGRTVLGPLKGHTSWVTSVAFSPDSTRIVSGSYDMTLRIWDTRSGQNVLDPLRGHTSWVMSVAFSPDSNYIVSGSDDNTIRMWDARNGQMVLGPFNGHNDSVNSVAFSPSGTHIVSGSGDKTICIWDAGSGLMVLGPLKGHTEPVRSVSFSPDGAHIVSGSWDKTIRIWDSRSGQTVLGPLTGSTHLITSVAFSPDGTRIVSGSWDKTIRMWDALTEQMDPSFGSSLATPALWTINKEGWVIDCTNESRLLLWVPSDLRRVLLPPRNILCVSMYESVGLNFTNVRIGESWVKCYHAV